MFTGQSTAEGATKNLSRFSEKTGLNKTGDENSSPVLNLV